MAKSYREGYADGYQAALRDVLTKQFKVGQEAADKWIENNLIDFTKVQADLYRESEYEYEAEQERRIAEHERELLERDLRG